MSLSLEEDENEKERDDERRDASDDGENIPVDGGKLRDGSMAHLEVGEQRDGLVPEPENQFKQDDDRAKRVLQHNSIIVWDILELKK